MEFTPETKVSELMALAPFKSSEDRKGHDIMLHARVPKEIGKMLEWVREVPGTPYKTNSDIVRDALFLGIHIVLLRLEQSQDWQAIGKIARMESDIKEITDIEIYIADVVRAIQGIFQRGQREEAIEDMVKLRQVIGEIGDKRRRKRFEEALNKCSVQLP